MNIRYKVFLLGIILEIGLHFFIRHVFTASESIRVAMSQKQNEISQPQPPPVIVVVLKRYLFSANSGSNNHLEAVWNF